MTLYRTGLVVGKFSPLHKGHQMVIDAAMMDCETVIILSYSSPEFAGCEADERRYWFSQLYPDCRVVVIDPDDMMPQNDDDDESHRRFCAEILLHNLHTTVDVVWSSEAYGDGFADYLAAFFGAKLTRPRHVHHVCVDRERKRHPVSGTMLRASRDPAWLAPEVRASLVPRICILGGESSGKTTLAAALAKKMGGVWVPEYGRRLWDERDGDLRYEDMACIGRRQVEDEREAAKSATGHLVCDTSPLTTLWYSRELFGAADPYLAKLAGRRYWMTVMCDPSIDFVQDGTRQDSDFRSRAHEWYLAWFRGHGISPVHVNGSVDERVQQVLAAVERVF